MIRCVRTFQGIGRCVYVAYLHGADDMAWFAYFIIFWFHGSPFHWPAGPAALAYFLEAVYRDIQFMYNNINRHSMIFRSKT